MSRLRRRQSAVRKQRRPRDSRSIPLWDETEQGNGVYYECWWCGFTCNDTRDILGGEAENDGKTQTGITNPIAQGQHGIGSVSDNTSELKLGGQLSVLIMVNGDMEGLTPLIRSDSDGNPVEPVHQFSTSTAGGCPLCGCKNYAGEF